MRNRAFLVVFLRREAEGLKSAAGAGHSLRRGKSSGRDGMLPVRMFPPRQAKERHQWEARL